MEVQSIRAIKFLGVVDHLAPCLILFTHTLKHLIVLQTILGECVTELIHPSRVTIIVKVCFF